MADRRTTTRTDRIAYGCLLAAFIVPLFVAGQYGRVALMTAIVPAAVGAVLSAAVLWWIGRRLADKWSIVFGLSWGAAGAALVGLQIVQLVYARGDWTFVRAVIFAPAVEESLKMLAVVATAALLSARERRRSGKLSFFLAAAASGVGFAFTENLVYFAMWYHQTPGFGHSPVEAMIHFGLVRGLVAFLGHPLFAGLGAAVIALGLGRRTGERLGLVAVGFAVAVGTHAIWNLIGEVTSGPLPVTAYGVLLLAIAVPVVLHVRGVTVPRVRPARPRPAGASRWRQLDVSGEVAGDRLVPPAYQSAKAGGVPDHNESVPWPASNPDVSEAQVERPVEQVEDHVRALLQQDHTAEALRLLDRLLSIGRSPAEVAKLRVLRLATVVAASPATDQDAGDAAAAAWSALADHPDPRLLGRYHTLAGSLRFGAGSIDEALGHLRDAEWALQGAQPGPGMVEAWYELAAAYSRADFHSLAFNAYRTARRLAATGDDAYSPGALVPVRLALSRDHRGDAEGCERILRTVVSDFEHRRREGALPTVPPYELAGYGYAAARLAALGDAVVVDPAPLLEAGGDRDAARALRQAGTACLSIAARQHTEALVLIGHISDCEDPLGAAELPRLRAIAYAGLAAFEAAYAAEREVTRLVARTLMRTREGLVTAAVAGREPAPRARGVDAALLDRLAGLPDRRFLEQHLRRLPRGTDVVLGMIDIHGVRHNPAAGLLLRRLTAILSQVLRQGDVIARYGESQFVVVLHDIGLGAAERIGKRMLRAVADQEWESLVPESRIGIDVGWAALDPSLRGIAAVTAALKALGEAQRARIT